MNKNVITYYIFNFFKLLSNIRVLLDSTINLSFVVLKRNTIQSNLATLLLKVGRMETLK